VDRDCSLDTLLRSHPIANTIKVTPESIWRARTYLPYLQPKITPQLILAAEQEIGFELPKEYPALLELQNGGYIRYSSKAVDRISQVTRSDCVFGLTAFDFRLAHLYDRRLPDGNWLPNKTGSVYSACAVRVFSQPDKALHHG
jgi:hypothetical protein